MRENPILDAGLLPLSQLHHPYWLWFTAFVGANIFQAVFTRFYPLARILASLVVRRGEVFN